MIDEKRHAGRRQHIERIVGGGEWAEGSPHLDVHTSYTVSCKSQNARQHTTARANFSGIVFLQPRLLEKTDQVCSKMYARSSFRSSPSVFISKKIAASKTLAAYTVLVCPLALG